MIEDEALKKRKLNEDKLISYDFIKSNNVYKYFKNIMDDTLTDNEIMKLVDISYDLFNKKRVVSSC
ncbi:MAG TPA: hypothetical protein IAC24_01200 [Candidatus Onthousia faecigallinarum]|nr:hypothetical protein [Candidatus Onthousia faecigallinarum]